MIIISRIQKIQLYNYSLFAFWLVASKFFHSIFFFETRPLNGATQSLNFNCKRQLHLRAKKNHSVFAPHSRCAHRFVDDRALAKRRSPSNAVRSFDFSLLNNVFTKFSFRVERKLQTYSFIKYIPHTLWCVMCQVFLREYGKCETF